MSRFFCRWARQDGGRNCSIGICKHCFWIRHVGLIKLFWGYKITDSKLASSVPNWNSHTMFIRSYFYSRAFRSFFCLKNNFPLISILIAGRSRICVSCVSVLFVATNSTRSYGSNIYSVVVHRQSNRLTTPIEFLKRGYVFCCSNSVPFLSRVRFRRVPDCTAHCKHCFTVRLWFA